MRKLCARIAGVVAAAAMATLPATAPTWGGNGRGPGSGPAQPAPARHPRGEAQKWAVGCEFTRSRADGAYGEYLYSGGEEDVTVDPAMRARMAEAQQYDYRRPRVLYRDRSPHPGGVEGERQPTHPDGHRPDISR
ncbi:hypothetical protein ACPESR_28115 [Nocardia testacea]|uniref:hypothetical protein n=1 Tax=Nocardia testacea TaxID=248551 RepID=UPI003C2CF992